MIVFQGSRACSRQRNRRVGAVLRHASVLSPSPSDLPGRDGHAAEGEDGSRGERWARALAPVAGIGPQLSRQGRRSGVAWERACAYSPGRAWIHEAANEPSACPALVLWSRALRHKLCRGLRCGPLPG
jgi:hypothetical protein